MSNIFEEEQNKINSCVNCGNSNDTLIGGLCLICYDQKVPNLSYASKHNNLIVTCSKCNKIKKIFNKKNNLCAKCYKELRFKTTSDPKLYRPLITCSKCNKIKERANKKNNLCRKCYTELRIENGYKPKQRICIKCGKLAVKTGYGMCKNCYSKWHYNLPNYIEHERQKRREWARKNNSSEKTHQAYIRKKERGYKKPIRTCVSCGAQDINRGFGLCGKCYRKLPHVIERKTKCDLNWRKKNPERAKELSRKSRVKCRLDKKNNLPDFIQIKIQNYINNIPEIKRQWVIEFLKTAYFDRANTTKLKFLDDISRLIDFQRSINPIKANAGWNALKLIEIEQCQIELGYLFHLKVFFKWLKSRKDTTDLSKAIPPRSSQRHNSKVTDDFIKGLFNRLNEGNDPLIVRIVGLLIIYYGLSVKELRNLKLSNFQEQNLITSNNKLPIDPILWGYICEYLQWRKASFLGFAPEFFIISGYSVTRKSTVSAEYFPWIFKKNNIGISPRDLRKAMMYFLKRNNPYLPYQSMAEIFGVTPRSIGYIFNT